MSITQKSISWFPMPLQVTITQTHRYESSHDTYSKVSAEAGASYGGLFYHGSASGGFEKSAENHALTKAGSNFSITFKVRKVNINRSWMDPSILLYSTLGIKGVTVGAWSSGELSATKNHGTFPIFPTAIVVAKDISLTADSYTDYASKTFKDMSGHAAVKVRAVSLFILDSDNQAGSVCISSGWHRSLFCQWKLQWCFRLKRYHLHIWWNEEEPYNKWSPDHWLGVHYQSLLPPILCRV